MNLNATSSQAAKQASQADSQRLNDLVADPVKGSANADSHVSESRHSLTDPDREEAIQRAGQAVIRHMADWERTGCFAARGDADRARRLMELLIAGRSPEQVQRMLAAQAKRMAREPGAERA